MKKRISIIVASVIILTLVAAIATAYMLARRNQAPATPAPSDGKPTAITPLSPQPAATHPTTASLTIENNAITQGPATMHVKPGKEFKLTVKGVGYGEGDLLTVTGYEQSFFELDETDGPVTQYFTFDKAGTYQLVLHPSGIHVGDIVVAN